MTFEEEKETPGPDHQGQDQDLNHNFERKKWYKTFNIAA